MAAEVITLGCRLNLSESESLRGLLAGAEDLVVVNSCAVTAEAVRQTRQAIRRARKARPDARLLVTGCAAEIERDMLVAMPEVDGIVSNLAKLDPRQWNVAPRPEPFRQHTRAFIPVQTGCDHACTFCVIPQGRGASCSLPVEQVVQRLRGFVQQGVQEAGLVGFRFNTIGVSDGISMGTDGMSYSLQSREIRSVPIDKYGHSSLSI